MKLIYEVITVLVVIVLHANKKKTNTDKERTAPHGILAYYLEYRITGRQICRSFSFISINVDQIDLNLVLLESVGKNEWGDQYLGPILEN